MQAVIYREVLENVELDVTPADIQRGTVQIECPSCEGTGEAFWHPGHPEGEGPPCVECSTRGTVGVTVA